MTRGDKSYWLSGSECSRLARLYDLERYLFEVVSERFRREQTLSPYDFFAIIIWKSNRTKTKVKGGLAEAGKTPSELMLQVSQAPMPSEKLDTLTQVRWIGLHIASAILAVCYPEEFTVLDYRAWNTATRLSIAGLPLRHPQNRRTYLQYCRACRDFAQRLGISLRDLDRALWASDWESDLLELIGNEREA